MKISELEAELKRLRKWHGDLEVTFNCWELGEQPQMEAVVVTKLYRGASGLMNIGETVLRIEPGPALKGAER